MRKTMVILLSVALLVSLAGCRSVTPSRSSSVISSPSSVSAISSEEDSDISEISIVSVTSSEETSEMTATNGTPEDHITYIAGYAVSYMKQGIEILTVDRGISWDVAEIAPNVPDWETLEKHYVSVMNSNGEKIPSEEPGNSNAEVVVSSNGNWDFFPTKVRYEEYTMQNQPNNPEWDDYFRSRIQEKSDDTPVIYLDAWFFDWNGDGIEDAFVNASNMIYTTEDKPKPNPPYADNTSVYMLSALFLSGNDPLETSGYVWDCFTKEPLEGEGISYNLSKEGRGGSTISAIQYDSEGNLMICPVYEGGYWFDIIYEDTMVLSDIDGDGVSEWIVFNLSEYTGIIVYKLIDGKPVEIFGQAMGA
ncbi:MAG TPA: hypothetical protein PK629_00095 [Oscillospiraceae bacterium]|nr:hypothetical protein [Oscillospiraceae bacterium]HPK35504.1 hypothetical protein [Oscillospiraceae bacterium]HPR76042.1 hypothetical protein [Oscillospiraceae bacterium]